MMSQIACRMTSSVLLLLCLSVLASEAFFVDIIKDEVGPGTEEDVIPRVWYRRRRTDPYVDTEPEFYPQLALSVDKRKPSLRPVSFLCNKKTAVCKNGGKGPRVNISKKGYAMCVCLCPPYHTGKQCAYQSDPGVSF